MNNRDAYVSVLKSAFITLGKDAVAAFLAKNVPFLVTGLLSPITAYIVGLVLEALVTQAETAAFFLYTDMRVNEQSRDFEKAAYANLAAQMSGTPEEKLRAEQNLKVTFRNFIHLAA